MDTKYYFSFQEINYEVFHSVYYIYKTPFCNVCPELLSLRMKIINIQSVLFCNFLFLFAILETLPYVLLSFPYYSNSLL